MDKPGVQPPPRDRRPLVAKALFTGAILVALAVAVLLFRMATSP